MASVKAAEEFDVDLFETRLESLKDTQEGIQQMSTWCLSQRAQHKKIVSCWLNVFKRGECEIHTYLSVDLLLGYEVPHLFIMHRIYPYVFR